jgi:hypothetical protein
MGLVQRGNMELSGEGGPSIHTFLAKFDAIFTLNQDLLLEPLELYYEPKRPTLGAGRSSSTPGSLAIGTQVKGEIGPDL